MELQLNTEEKLKEAFFTTLFSLKSEEKGREQATSKKIVLTSSHTHTFVKYNNFSKILTL